MHIRICSRYDETKVLFEGDYASLFDAVVDAAKNRANLCGAYLRGANLCGADLGDANLRDANLCGVRVNWKSHALLAEILWRAAGDNEPRAMLAAYVGRKTGRCWEQWEAWEHPDKKWALCELAKWCRDGDDAPDCVRRYAAQPAETAEQGATP
jgi:hypothetical protein